MPYSKSYNNQNGVTYVYEVLENYWDKETKKSRSKRRLVGKIDPDTGKMVPTGKRGRKPKNPDTASSPGTIDYRKEYEAAQKEILKKDAYIEELENALIQYLDEEQSALKNIESSVRARFNHTDALLKKYKSADTKREK